MATATDTGTPPQTTGLRVRVVFRDGAGKVDLDLPGNRIGEVIADVQGTVWVDIENPQEEVAGVEALLRDVFHFHPLAIEDALQETHVPKVDDWDGYLYTVFHAIDFDPESDTLRLHELDIFLGANYLVTYHSRPMRVLDQLRRTLERDGGLRLRSGPDHLLYHIFDLGTADYLTAIEHLDEAIDRAQDEVFHAPTPETLQKIFHVKRSAMRMHRIIAPQREVFNRLARDLYPQIDAKDRVYFRDVYDHMVRLHDVTETLRDLISGALDTYLSSISNRTNDVMKTLTIATVFFLPLNFLVGFFGMNFFGDNLHLSEMKFPHVLIFGILCFGMVASPWAMWIWVKRRGWF